MTVSYCFIFRDTRKKSGDFSLNPSSLGTPLYRLHDLTIVQENTKCSMYDQIHFNCNKIKKNTGRVHSQE